MKSISLIQPWASLIANGIKTIETRSLNTHHRGPLAIHASKSIPAWVYSLCAEPEMFAILKRYGLLPIDELPRGVVLATCRLVDVDHITFDYNVSPVQRPLGDFRPGRYAWWLKDIKRLAIPIPARGALGLWDWQPPVEQ